VGVLRRQPHGCEGACGVGEKLPPDDPASAEGPYLRPLLVEGSTAASSTAPFAHPDNNTRACIYELLCIELVLEPSAPVVARSLDDSVTPDVDAVEVEDGTVAEVPHNVLVEQCPEGFHALDTASDELNVLLRHRARSIPEQAQES
jgi:hypothetical protein